MHKDTHGKHCLKTVHVWSVECKVRRAECKVWSGVIFRETSSNFDTFDTVSDRLECHKVPRLPRKTTWQPAWKPSKRRGFAASPIDTELTMPRRRDDDATSNWRQTRVQPPNPQTINGNPSLRIREKLPTCQTVRLHMCSCRYFENMSPKTKAAYIAPQTAVTSLSSVSPRQRGQRRQPPVVALYKKKSISCPVWCWAYSEPRFLCQGSIWWAAMFFQRNLLQVAKLHVGAEPPQNLREGDATVPSQSALHTHSDCLALSDFSRYQLLCLTEQASVTLQAHQLLLQNFISTISVVIRICSPGRSSQGRGAVGQVDPQIGIGLVSVERASGADVAASGLQVQGLHPLSDRCRGWCDRWQGLHPVSEGGWRRCHIRCKCQRGRPGRAPPGCAPVDAAGRTVTATPNWLGPTSLQSSSSRRSLILRFVLPHGIFQTDHSTVFAHLIPNIWAQHVLRHRPRSSPGSIRACHRRNLQQRRLQV